MTKKAFDKISRGLKEVREIIDAINFPELGRVPSPFQTRAGLSRSGRHYRYPKTFPRLRWQLYIRRMETRRSEYHQYHRRQERLCWGGSPDVRALRRHQAQSHMRRRLKEDRNQHYDDLKCACWTDPRAMARFKEQPQVCSFHCCGNHRRWEKGQGKLTMQERRQTATYPL